jgi:hypothetical protein
VVLEQVSPELVLVLPEEERRAVLAGLPDPRYARAHTAVRRRPGTTEAQRDEQLSGPYLVAAAGAYALVRVATALPYYAVTVVPLIALLVVLGLLQ